MFSLTARHKRLAARVPWRLPHFAPQVELLEERTLLSADFLYWSSLGENGVQNSAIMRCRLDGTGEETVIAGSSTSRFAGVAVDEANGYLYGTDGPTIYRANLDGTGRVDLLTPPVGPGELELDVPHGKMYWGVAGVFPTALYRANLDGSDVERIYSNPGGNVEGIAVDSAHGKLYFTDELTGIWVSDLDGSNRTSFQATANPFDLEIDTVNGRLYWNDYGWGAFPNGAIQRANLDGSGSVETVYVSQTRIDNGIHFDPVHQEVYYASTRDGPYSAIDMNRIAADGTGHEVLFRDPGGIAYMAVAHNVPTTDNTPPQPAFTGPDSGVRGQPLSYTGGFTDPDAGDSWSATVDYGDGGGAQPLALNADKTFAFSHAYVTSGTYTVTVAVQDNNGGSGTATQAVTVIPPASLSGIAFEDFNGDGQVDFGEKGIAEVSITLAGTDDQGHAVNLTQQTDADGAYVFLDLRPGNYTITEVQPTGYTQGINSVGTAGGSLSATDQFSVQLGQGIDGLNYNFGEQPPSGGSVQKGQTATIGFWNNKNGQALIKSLNGGTGTQLGDWLAATLPNTFGTSAAYNLAGQGNAAVAALFQSDFVLKGVKLDAQVLATALSVYVTNATLDATGVAAQYGFTVSGDGVGTATVNVGSNGDAFGVADNSILTVMDLLRATDAQTINGVLYGGNTTRRSKANNVYSAINQTGDIN